MTSALEKRFRRHGLADRWKDVGVRPPSADESLVIDFLMSYSEIGRYPVRAEAQPEDGRLISPTDARPLVLRMLDAPDAKIAERLPQANAVIARPNLGSLGCDGLECVVSAAQTNSAHHFHWPPAPRRSVRTSGKPRQPTGAALRARRARSG